MNRKMKRKIAVLFSILVFAALFCVRLTGKPLHILLGLVFIVVLGVHTWKRRKRMAKCPFRLKAVDLAALISMMIVLVTGFMLKPMKDVMWVLLLHKFSALIMAVSTLVHIYQHNPKGKKSCHIQ